MGEEEEGQGGHEEEVKGEEEDEMHAPSQADNRRIVDTATLRRVCERCINLKWPPSGKHLAERRLFAPLDLDHSCLDGFDMMLDISETEGD